jgi:glycosyltransferase involved in cell wall biosynthesis
VNIVHLDSQVPWRGGEQQVLHLSQLLYTWGHNSVIVCQPQSALYQRAQEAHVPVQALRMHHELDFVAAWKLGQYLRRHQVEILHMHAPHAHAIGLLAGVWAPTVHKVVSRRTDFAPIRNVLSRWKYTLPKVHYVAVSEAVRQVLIASGIPAHSVQTIYSSIDVRRFNETQEIAPLFPTGTRVVGTVGHLTGLKGHRYLLEAARQVLQAEPHVGIAIVGDGALRQELEAQAANLGIAERVHFTGFRRDIPALIRGFEIFVFSSTHEGTPNSVLEAMALGKPVVATHAGGTAEVVQDGVTGLLVSPRDPAALAHALLYVLRHPEQGKMFGMAGRKRVEEHFTVEHMAGSTLQAYHRILADVPA